MTMIGFLFFFFGLLVTLGMCAMAAWSDYKGFRIPNMVSIVIAAAFAVAYGATYVSGQVSIVFGDVKSHLIAAGAVLLVTMLLFGLKLLGAGDSKFAAAVSLWLGVPGLAPFLFYMALIGGVLGVASLALRRWKPFKNPPEGSWPDKAQSGHNSVPYGIAIAGGVVAAFLYRGYFTLSLWAEMFNA